MRSALAFLLILRSAEQGMALPTLHVGALLAFIAPLLKHPRRSKKHFLVLISPIENKITTTI